MLVNINKMLLCKNCVFVLEAELLIVTRVTVGTAARVLGKGVVTLNRGHPV